MSILKNNTLLTQKDTHAQTFYARFKGLLGKNSFTSGEALILTPCKSIHTFFMRFVIDVLFLDGNGKVVGKAENLSPFRFSPLFWRARTCVELPVRTIKDSLTQISDTILIEP